MAPAALEAARPLWQYRCAGTMLDQLPEALRPGSLEAGHAIPAAWPAVSGQAVLGCKTAETSAAGQVHIHVGGSSAGRILAPQRRACRGQRCAFPTAPTFTYKLHSFQSSCHSTP